MTQQGTPADPRTQRLELLILARLNAKTSAAGGTSGRKAAGTKPAERKAAGSKSAGRKASPARAAGKKERAGRPATRNDLRRDLAAFAGDDLSPSGWHRELDERLTSLAARGLIAPGRTFRLTRTGKEHLARASGCARAPAWDEMQQRILPALALASDPTSREVRAWRRDERRLQASLLARAYGLPLVAPTLDAAVNALIARALGTQRPVRDTRSARDALGASWVARGPWQPPGAPAARPAAAPGRSARAGRATQVARGRSGSKRPDASVSATPRRPAGSLVTPPALPDFASAVRAAAAREEAPGRFGDQKIFIAALWRRLHESDARFAGMSLEEFKKQLVAANGKRLLLLARADFPSAMDAAEVNASHIHDRNSDFHFVIDETRGHR